MAPKHVTGDAPGAGAPRRVALPPRPPDSFALYMADNADAIMGNSAGMSGSSGGGGPGPSRETPTVVQQVASHHQAFSASSADMARYTALSLDMYADYQARAEEFVKSAAAKGKGKK